MNLKDIYMDLYYFDNHQVFLKHGNYSYNIFPLKCDKKPNFDFGYFCRYIDKYDIEKETEWYYVIKEGSEELDNYKSSKKRHIIKGLDNFKVSKIDIETVRKQGYVLFKKWNDSFGNLCNEEEYYEQINYDNKSEQIIDYFGIFDKENNLVGYSKNYIVTEPRKIAFYETIAYDPNCLLDNINYAVIHEMNKYYLNELKFDFITNGSKNVYHKTNIQDFLISKFNYRKAYCTMKVVYRKDIKILVNLLYPFRKFLKKIEKIDSLLFQEEIRRSFLE